MMTEPERLRLLLALYGRRQDEIAIQLGWSKQYLNNVLHGRDNPSADTCRRVALAIVGGQERPAPRRRRRAGATSAPVAEGAAA